MQSAYTYEFIIPFVNCTWLLFFLLGETCIRLLCVIFYQHSQGFSCLMKCFWCAHACIDEECANYSTGWFTMCRHLEPFSLDGSRGVTEATRKTNCGLLFVPHQTEHSISSTVTHYSLQPCGVASDLRMQNGRGSSDVCKDNETTYVTNILPPKSIFLFSILDKVEPKIFWYTLHNVGNRTSHVRCSC